MSQTTGKPVVLCVDDEPNVLSGLRRALRSSYDVLTAEGGAAGLAVLAERDDIEVVVSDMRMPEMSGAQFLAKVCESWPDTTRVLLTGQSDLESAIAAVNEGQIFRFLTKPSTKEDLLAALGQAVEQHRLIVAERELTEGTLRGVIDVLVDVLAMVNPAAHAASRRVIDQVSLLANAVGVEGQWEFEVAAMLSTLGRVAVPDDVLERAELGHALTPAERESIAAIPEIGANLVAKIPRMEAISQMVRLQSGPLRPEWLRDPENRVGVGAGLLKVATSLVKLAEPPNNFTDARRQLIEERGLHHPSVMDALVALDGLYETTGEPQTQRRIPLRDLTPGQILDEDLVDEGGMMLVASGTALSEPMLARIQRFRELRDLPSTVLVTVPLEDRAVA